MFLLLKLLLLPIWLPFKILAELLEHSGRNGRRRRRVPRASARRPRPAVPVAPGMRQASRRRTVTAWAAIGVITLAICVAAVLADASMPASTPAKPAAATVSASPSASPTLSPSPAPSPTHAKRHHPAAVVTHSAPPAPSCYPLSNAGHCYEPGEFCRIADAGTTGVAGDGEKIKCEDNNGWRWEPI
jgi:hypothetical protein